MSAEEFAGWVVLGFLFFAAISESTALRVTLIFCATLLLCVGMGTEVIG